MSGGISAIKGFDYQATVILDRLFDHFDQHAPTAKARPEGKDDLDLSWIENAVEHRHYVQIKKPTEDCNGNINPTRWTLLQTIRELLPNTITNLSGNKYRQIWIVGDEVDDAVTSLVKAGEDAPNVVARHYWFAVHTHARNDTLASFKLNDSIRAKLLKWKVPDDLPVNPEAALSRLVSKFVEFTSEVDADIKVGAFYSVKVAELHNCLPDVLYRTEIYPTYGTEQEVKQRVYDLLTQHYLLQPTVIENTLFRNLRGFINDISKQPGRQFNQQELEVELRCVWPKMIPIKDAPPLDSFHVARRDLSEYLTIGWTGMAIEAVGISGSGKTVLASEVVELSRITNPERLVYYAEVRPEHELRDVLVGVAYHLRRYDILEPFAISVESCTASEEIITRLAHSYSTIPRKIFMMVDLVEGNCSTAFARDLTTFIRALSSSECKIVVFGQESAFRELNSLERDEYGVSRLDVRGFNFDEFVKLVSFHHSSPDRAKLQEIYQTVTVGRASGLFAKLAQSLARASSLKEMSDMVSRPAKDILAHAEQQRFARISKGAQSAAEKLVCFALPFLQKDAEEIFLNENVGAAIRELLSQGLLYRHDKDSFEMHETVRAGLEGLIALGVRRSAHEALSAWYAEHGLIAAEILHLEKNDKLTEAQTRAKEVFLRGEQWAALSAYIIRHKLVSGDEVIRVFAVTKLVENVYLMTSILRELGEPINIDELVKIIREQQERFFTDYQWAMAVIETILDFDPERLHDLIIFSIDMATTKAQMEFALGWLMIAMRRKSLVIGSRTIEFFNTEQLEIKRLLLGILLLDRRREALHAAFQFLAEEQDQVDGQRGLPIQQNLILHIRNRKDVVEFLSAMPRAQVSTMLASKSTLLGQLSSIVWGQRNTLRSHCIEILQDATGEMNVIENAIRVLLFLAEPLIVMLCEPFLKRDDFRGFASLVPILVPSLCDRSLYESRLLDCNASLEDRIVALFVLATLGSNLGDIYRRLKATEKDLNTDKGWDVLFLMLSNQAPFPEAIPLLEEFMKSADHEGINVIVSVLTKLGELHDPAAITILTQALNHANPQIRQCAIIGLSQRRSHATLASLIDRFEKEEVEQLLVLLAAAIVASGPRSVSDLQGCHDSPSIQLWQCILAMRLRAVNMADTLVSIAVDQLNNWQLRRAAIFAAGRLPYEAALERILPVIMAERSPLTIDRHSSLHCHVIMSSIIKTYGSQSLVPIFARGRIGFVEFFAEAFEAHLKKQEGLPSGEDAAGWLFDRLLYHGCPVQQDVLDCVLNEIHIPMLHSAVLRALRLTKRPELIEEQLSVANYTWFAMKCLKERSRAEKRDPDLASRLQNLVEASPCKGNELLHRVIKEIGDSYAIRPPVEQTSVANKDARQSRSYVSYDDVLCALSDARQDFKVMPPLVIENITIDQCEQLIRLANPANDYNRGIESYVPSIQFTTNGHIVAQRRVTYTGGDSIEAFIRPAITAANRFGLPIPWHQELMTSALATTYIPKYLDCLGALNNSDRFYEEVAQFEDLLIPYLCNVSQVQPVLKYVNARIIPTLVRYASSGTDDIFEGLCTLAAQVNDLEIDSVLNALLFRWTRRFDMNAVAPQHDDNYQLWRGFKKLVEHPRFTLIDGWRSQLSTVLQMPLAWFCAEDIVRVLEHDYRSYILIESRLFRTVNWEHFHQDEIDRLDNAAECLFWKVQD